MTCSLLNQSFQRFPLSVSLSSLILMPCLHSDILPSKGRMVSGKEGSEDQGALPVCNVLGKQARGIARRPNLQLMEYQKQLPPSSLGTDGVSWEEKALGNPTSSGRGWKTALASQHPGLCFASLRPALWYQPPALQAACPFQTFS